MFYTCCREIVELDDNEGRLEGDSYYDIGFNEPCNSSL